MRVPYQVLVFPYYKGDKGIEYDIFHRSDVDYWQGIVGSSLWGENVYVVNEYCYGVEIIDKYLKLSNEHTEYKWLNYNDVISILKWDSNKTALWELNKRLVR